MNDLQLNEAINVEGPVQNDGSLLNFAISIAKHKKPILTVTGVAAVAALAISLVIPDSYKASVKLMPPQQAQSGAAAMLAQLGGMASAVGGAAGLKNRNDLYIGMLKSRSIANKLIERFELKKVFGTSSPEKTRRILDENTVVSSGKDGLIQIDVELEDKKLAAAVANAYVEELLMLTKVLEATEASQRRLFFEKQLEQAKDKLANAESALKGALDVSGMVSVDGETRAITETVGRLRAQIAVKEIELMSTKSSLRTEFNRLQNGGPGAVSEHNSANNSPAGLANMKIIRDVKYYQMLYELLAKQYETARLDEAKDSSVIPVLDPAVEPEKKSKPRRSIIVLLSTLLTFVAAVAIALAVEGVRRTSSAPGRREQYRRLRSYLWAK